MLSIPRNRHRKRAQHAPQLTQAQRREAAIMRLRHIAKTTSNEWLKELCITKMAEAIAATYRELRETGEQ